MTKPTGRPRGRSPGAKNKLTKEREAAMAEAAGKVCEALGTTAFDGDAHALLMLVYKDTSRDIALRVDAAKAAIRYEKPALANIEQKLDAEVRQRVISSEPLSDEEWEARYGASQS